MNNLKDIHNSGSAAPMPKVVVLSRFQWTIWRIYTTNGCASSWARSLFCQDFNEQFEGYTQRYVGSLSLNASCFVKISMNNLKDIHNYWEIVNSEQWVVLSRFQWTIWRIYTTAAIKLRGSSKLFCQDFNEQFEGYTQLYVLVNYDTTSCFVKISMNNLKDIHNILVTRLQDRLVVLSRFQWTIWRIYTTKQRVLVQM